MKLNMVHDIMCVYSTYRDAKRNKNVNDMLSCLRTISGNDNIDEKHAQMMIDYEVGRAEFINDNDELLIRIAPPSKRYRSGVWYKNVCNNSIFSSNTEYKKVYYD